MFHFRKKDKSEEEREAKERRKREKRERKHRIKEQQMAQQQLTPEDLRRLDEVRRSLRGGSTDSSGASSSGGGAVAAGSDVYDASNLENRPGGGRPHLARPSALPPPPPSRGILKGKNSNSGAKASASASAPSSSGAGAPAAPSASPKTASAASPSSADDYDAILLKNTQANEAILYENVVTKRRSVVSTTTTMSSSSSSTFSSKLSPVEGSQQDREVSHEMVATVQRVRAHKDHVSPVSPPKRNTKQVNIEMHCVISF